MEKDCKVFIRIADHPADKENRWRYKYDICTNIKRPGAINYIEFLAIWEKVLNESKKSRFEKNEN